MDLSPLNVQEVHFAQVTAEIDEILNEMASKYDTKVLACVMMGKAAYLLRMLENLNVMDAKEVNDTVIESIRGIHDEIARADLPKVKTIGKPGRLS